MDVGAVTVFLAPFLASLLKGTQAALESVAADGVATAADHAQRLWDRLRGRIAERPDAEAAARKLASSPDSGRRQRALGEQLELLLAAEPELARELAQLWEQAQSAGVVAIASGDRSAAIGGAVSGSTIVLGDNVSIDQ